MQQKIGQQNSENILIYTDGSSLGNPGPGGYGCVIVFQDREQVIELGDRNEKTTNNKMELTAIIQSLHFLKKQDVSPQAKIVIRTDSSYAINGITRWIFGWIKNNWKTSTKTEVLNSDLWKELFDIKNYFQFIQFEHVRGHSGIWGNERCDMIATSFAAKNPIELFDGSAKDYYPEIHSTETIKKTYTQYSGTTISTKKNTDTKSKKAYSYVALVNGNIQTFRDWESCKKVVHGRSSKYKKVLSEQEEKKLIKEWEKEKKNHQ